MEQVQTRTEEGEIQQFNTLKEAFNYAEINPSVWKVSFYFKDERVRLVREVENVLDSDTSYIPRISWVYEPIDLDAIIGASISQLAPEQTIEAEEFALESDKEFDDDPDHFCVHCPHDRIGRGTG